MRALATKLPGLLVSVALAAVAWVIGGLVPAIGAPVPAIVLGVIAGRLIDVHDRNRESSGWRTRMRPGITTASKFVLQFSVMLLGAQLSLGQVAKVGYTSLPVLLITLIGCLVAAWLIGRWLGVLGDLRTLIGVGTSICGASAIAAAAPVIGAVSADVAYAVSTIFLFNVTAVLVFPVLGHALGMSQHGFGLFAGTAVNDTSSVVAAATTYGSVATDYAVVVKLVRTLMIIPICLALAAARRKTATTPPRVWKLVPWFLIGFVVVAAANSFGVIPDGWHHPLRVAASFMIATALAGIGLSTDVAGLRRAGWRPLALGGLLWIVVTALSLGTQALIGAG